MFIKTGLDVYPTKVIVKFYLASPYPDATDGGKPELTNVPLSGAEGTVVGPHGTVQID